MKENKDDKVINAMKMFFTISNATFNFHNAVVMAIGHNPHMSKMHELHKIAFNEVNKENPNIEFILKLVDEMQILAEENAKD